MYCRVENISLQEDMDINNLFGMSVYALTSRRYTSDPSVNSNFVKVDKIAPLRSPVK